MDRDKNLNLILRDIQQLLAEEKVYHEDRVKRILALEHRLALITLGERPTRDDVDSSHTERVVIADGHRLSQEQTATLDEDDFDVILDMTTRRLRYRTNPAKHTDLVTSDLQGVGPARIRILAFLLEYPSRHISWDNLPDCYHSDDQPLSPEAFVKSISVLRNALGMPGRANPYILCKPAWESSPRKRACVYTMNSDHKYLLIKWANKKSR